ncbi:unnamed protein product [Lathyrus sativus]|nr:unnamed protein product [Lathyrus sativus]
MLSLSYSSSSGKEIMTSDTQNKKKISQRGVTMLTKVTKVHKSDNKFPIVFDLYYRVVDGEYSSLFKSYVAFLGCSKVSILIDDWKQAPEAIKDSI